MKTRTLIATTLTLLLLSASCTLPLRLTTAVSVDLSRYADEGFLIIEGTDIGLPYTPVCIVTAISESGNEENPKDAKGKTIKSDDEYGFYASSYGRTRYIRGSLAEAIALLHREALAKGADAIINLRYTYTPASLKPAIPESWTASGMAVKTLPAPSR